MVTKYKRFCKAPCKHLLRRKIGTVSAAFLPPLADLDLGFLCSKVAMGLNCCDMVLGFIMVSFCGRSKNK